MMMTTIAIAIKNSDTDYKLVTMADGDAITIGNTLKTYYNTLELANALLDQGNIQSLGNTISESVFTNEPVTNLESIDIRESEITIADKNVFLTPKRSANHPLKGIQAATDKT